MCNCDNVHEYVNLHFFFLNFISHLIKKLHGMPIIHFPSERIFNSATYMQDHYNLC